jgi:hypothetical protein
MLLFVDIETIPSQAPGALALVRDGIKPPGTLKKPESIANWWLTEADQAVQDQYRKQSLDGGTQGEIISIACCTDDGREWVHCRPPGGFEDELLGRFFDTVDAWTLQDTEALFPHGRAGEFPLDDHTLVAHNAVFDIGYLWRRATVHGLVRPRWLPGPTARAGKDYADTMLLWSGHGGRVTLDALCRALGVESPKGDLDGSQVFDAWLASETARIAEYNLQDVRATREVFRRLVGGGAGALARFL